MLNLCWRAKHWSSTWGLGLAGASGSLLGVGMWTSAGVYVQEGTLLGGLHLSAGDLVLCSRPGGSTPSLGHLREKEQWEEPLEELPQAAQAPGYCRTAGPAQPFLPVAGLGGRPSMRGKKRDFWMPIPLSQPSVVPDPAHFLSLQVHWSQPPTKVSLTLTHTWCYLWRPQTLSRPAERQSAASRPYSHPAWPGSPVTSQGSMSS